MGIRRRLLRQQRSDGEKADPASVKEGLLIRKAINTLEKQINSTPKQMHPMLAQNFFGGCREGWKKRIRKRLEKGKGVTVEYLMEDFDKYPRFLEQCERIGLDRGVFQEMAEELIKEVVTGRETGKVAVGD